MNNDLSTVDAPGSPADEEAISTTWIHAEIKKRAIRATRYIRRVIESTNKSSRAQALKESRHSKTLTVWKDDLVPNWDETTRRSDRVLTLIDLGIPSCIRGIVWPLFIGNDQGLDRDVFFRSPCRYSTDGFKNTGTTTSVDSTVGIEQDAQGKVESVSQPDSSSFQTLDVSVAPGISPCNRIDVIAGKVGGVTETTDDTGASAEEQEQNDGEDDEEDRVDQLASALQVMEVDIPRTFPTLAFFHNGTSEEAALHAVLHSFATLRPEIGYIQGMTYVAAILLLFMDADMAFQCLANLVVKTGCREFFGMDKIYIDRYANCFDRLLSQCLPTLHRHLVAQGIQSAMFLMDWKLTLFGKALSLEAVVRIWDRYLLSGEAFFMQCCVGLVSFYEPRLVRMDTGGIMKLLLHFPEDLSVDELFSHMRKRMRVSYDDIEEMMTEFDLL